MTETLAHKPRVDLHQRVTDEIVRAIEAGAGSFIMPWHGAVRGAPRNPHTGDRYHGINVLVLWSVARTRGYTAPYWATYRQWTDLRAQVRKGEKATLVVFYKKVLAEAVDDRTGKPVEDYRLIARAFYVFNAAQVDGWTPPNTSVRAEIGTHQEIDDFIAATGADIRRGDIAAYHQASDVITMPDPGRFIGSGTRTATESYYATIFHELVHWTGNPHRLARNLSGRFGTADYAMEELVAELGAAFLCAEYLVLHVPRQDHAAYIGDWLQVLKNDKRAIFTAATKASEAIGFLMYR